MREVPRAQECHSQVDLAASPHEATERREVPAFQRTRLVWVFLSFFVFHMRPRVCFYCLA